MINKYEYVRLITETKTKYISSNRFTFSEAVFLYFKNKKRKAEVDRLFAKMYEDWANERITECNFNMMSERYQNEQHELDEKICTLEAELTIDIIYRFVGKID